MPIGKQVAYVSFVYNHRLLKTETWRAHLVVGGDKLNYDSDAGSPAFNLVETNILIISTILDAKKGTRCTSFDLNDFFLASQMKE